MKYIVQGLGEPTIDLKVYRPDASLRICNSPKYNSKTKQTSTFVYPCEDDETFNLTLINNISDL